MNYGLKSNHSLKAYDKNTHEGKLNTPEGELEAMSDFSKFSNNVMFYSSVWANSEVTKAFGWTTPATTSPDYEKKTLAVISGDGGLSSDHAYGYGVFATVFSVNLETGHTAAAGGEWVSGGYTYNNSKFQIKKLDGAKGGYYIKNITYNDNNRLVRID